MNLLGKFGFQPNQLNCLRSNTNRNKKIGELNYQFSSLGVRIVKKINRYLFTNAEYLTLLRQQLISPAKTNCKMYRLQFEIKQCKIR